MRLKAVIFDMDGVLSDTEPLHAIAEQETLMAFGIAIKTDEILRRFIGRPSPEVWPEIFKEYGIEMPDVGTVEQRASKRLEEIAKGQIRAISGSRELLTMIANYRIPLGLASGSHRNFINMVLEELELQNVFAAVTSSYEVQRGKPAPDVFLLTAKKLEVDPTQCLVIEDARAGVLAGKTAGMTVIGYKAKNNNQDLSMADYIVQDLDEISEKMLLSL